MRVRRHSLHEGLSSLPLGVPKGRKGDIQGVPFHKSHAWICSTSSKYVAERHERMSVGATSPIGFTFRRCPVLARDAPSAAKESRHAQPPPRLLAPSPLIRQGTFVAVQESPREVAEITVGPFTHHVPSQGPF